MNMANRDIKPDNILFATIENGTNNTHEDRA
jgi:serine/threonine protein kinase